MNEPHILHCNIVLICTTIHYGFRNLRNTPFVIGAHDDDGTLESWPPLAIGVLDNEIAEIAYVIGVCAIS